MKVEIQNSSNQWIDITPWIAWQGLSFSVNSVDAPDAGRDITGLMHRGMVAIKEKMNVNTIPMKRSDVANLITLLLPESFKVRVDKYPNTNASKTMTMYSNNIKTTHVIHRESGEDLQTVSFPLIEL